ncbi:RNA methyltransferase [Algibacillus agarilyticus]|uniref:RNA methyltransferase n=1 Tax=Algibacillus agarilyticus TaxID=2234133 RepID=UPI000DD05B63|nr:RNA methyltransferase [Algibacillus agarilyticus]
MNNQFACVGLLNPKSPENVGSIMRAAGCYQVNSVFYTGRRYDKAREFKTDTQKVYQRIPLIGVPDLKQVIPLGATPVAIEFVEGAKPLIDYKHPDNAFYVFGPEDGSVSQEVLDWCQDVVYVPTVGCMNLAATVNVLLYDRLAKSGLANYSPQLIEASRDTNNKAKV